MSAHAHCIPMQRRPQPRAMAAAHAEVRSDLMAESDDVSSTGCMSTSTESAIRNTSTKYPSSVPTPPASSNVQCASTRPLTQCMRNQAAQLGHFFGQVGHALISNRVLNAFGMSSKLPYVGDAQTPPFCSQSVRVRQLDRMYSTLYNSPSGPTIVSLVLTTSSSLQRWKSAVRQHRSN